MSRLSAAVALAPEVPRLFELGFGSPAERPYNALTPSGVVIGDLLMQHSPALADGRIEIVRIARLPGLMAKVAVRPTRRFQGGPHPVSLVVGTGAVHVRPIVERLGGEALHVVRWRREPQPFIADALWLSSRPSMHLESTPDGRRHATVLLGDVDARGAVGKQACNVRTASWLTDWQIRIRPLTGTPAWQVLADAKTTGAVLAARAVERIPSGLIVEVGSLRALLPFGRLHGVGPRTAPTVLEARLHELLEAHTFGVRVQRLDPDFGRVYVVEAPPDARTLLLPL